MNDTNKWANFGSTSYRLKIGVNTNYDTCVQFWKVIDGRMVDLMKVF